MTARTDDDPGIGRGGFAGSPMPQPAELPGEWITPTRWAELREGADPVDFRRFHLNDWKGATDGEA